MATAVRNMVQHVGVSIAETAIMAATAPARFLGVGSARGSLAIGQRADLVWLDAGLAVQDVFIGAQNHVPQVISA